MPQKIQLALQGGGARLFGLIAAMEAIDELNEEDTVVEVTRIAGTSAGAIVGGLWAAGIPGKELRREFSSIKYKQIPRKLGLIDILCPIFKNHPILTNDPLVKICRNLIGDRKFSDLPIPFFAIVSDITAKRKRIFGGQDSQDLIWEKLIDSSALPFVFKTSGKYFDGGICENLHIDTLKRNFGRMKYGEIIALSFPHPKSSVRPSSWRETLLPLLETIINNSVHANKLTDIEVIELPVGSVGLLDFFEAQEHLKDQSSLYLNIKYHVKHDIIKILNNNDLPMNRRRFQRIRADHPDFHLTKIQYESPRYNIFSTPYTDKPAIAQLQNALSSHLEKIWPEAHAVPSMKYFDAFRRPEVAVADEVIYAFPFFLTYLRQSTWGVVRYGWHRRLGVLVNKKLPNYNKVKQDVLSRNDDRPHWLGTLLHELNSGSKIFSLEGYLYNELLPLMVMSLRREVMQARFRDHSEVISLHKLGLDEHASRTEVFEKFASFIKDKKRSVAVVDLADANTLDTGLKQDEWEILSAPHHLQVPVGVGFSWLMFPRIEKEWSEIRRKAFGLLEGAEQQFEDIGIELEKK